MLPCCTESLSYSDIRPRYGTFRTVHVSGSGRDKTYKHITGVMTGIGDIEEAAWRKLAMDVIGFNGDDGEFNKKLAYVKRQKKYNQCKTEIDFMQKALESFLYEKSYPEKWAAIKSRRRFAARDDFEQPPDFKDLNWIGAAAEVMEDGSEWVAVITDLGEVQEDLWLVSSLRLIKHGGHDQELISEIKRLRERYAKLLENGRVDNRFIKLSSVQSVVRHLAGLLTT